MQQFWYRNAAEYDAHIQQMQAAGWTMTHWQVNDDGSMSATWEPPLYPTAPPLSHAPQTAVGIYDNDAAYRRGVARMIRAGWQVKDVAMTQNGRPLAGILLMGIFAKQRIKYTVIFTR